jgi:uracil-DNA glycosylase family protein
MRRKGSRQDGSQRDPEDPAQKKIPSTPTLGGLAQIAQDCKACELWRRGTQTVFGEGSPNSRVMIVGEVPGDQEDRIGKPFVGPAGHLLDKALEEAGIDRAKVYVTNAVKHFNWEPRGKRRIHKKPSAKEIAACRPWLDAEIARLHPRVIICLGATAAQALLGKDFRVTHHRGEFVDSMLAPYVTATVHPSAILRAPDDETRHEEARKFVADLKRVAKVINSGSEGDKGH